MLETDIVERLKENSDYLRNRLKAEGFNIMGTETAIIPLVVGDLTVLGKMAKDAFDQGFIINPICPPAVPPNLTRFRISVMSSHTKEDMEALIKLIISLFEKYGVNRFVSK